MSVGHTRNSRVATILALVLSLTLFTAPSVSARGSGHSGHHSSGGHHSGKSSHKKRSGKKRSKAESSHKTRSGKKRSKAARDAFMNKNPCPANGHTSGACPGYVVDHIVPLKRGGADAPSNMQWQTIEEGKAKDKIE